ncbi:MAG: homocysteine S-methyltransferase family protein [Rhodobacteraceae bacterium]|nr:homocysteine S-methyltransferase family protein [Paracoccaceae bacterium]
MIQIALLDGGLGQEIHSRSGAKAHPLWSLKVMFDAPQIVVDAHVAFIDAGARVISLNTYAATPTRLARHGFGDRFDEAYATAIALARSAIAKANTPAGPIQIAGCLPPLVASYHAEARKDYAASLDEYRQIVRAQQDDVDLFLIETMSNIEEASAALDAARETSLPVYLALSVSDDLSNTLRSGEPLTEALAALVPRSPDGLLLNCSSPEAITRAMPLLAATGLRFGGYANGFTSVEALAPGGTVDTLGARADMTPETYAGFARQWIAQGATIVGGCCEIGPAHIAYLAKRLEDAGHEVGGLGG